MLTTRRGQAHPGTGFEGRWAMPRGTPMLLALMLWLCSLVLVAAVILPFFGGRIAIFAGLGLLLFFVLACHLICVIRVDPEKERS